MGLSSPKALGHKKAMNTPAQPLQIRLRLKGGSGQNANWQWELLDAAGAVVKSGSAMGPEHKAFATARQAKEKLEKAAAS